jgi:hypothetical protein
MGAAIGAARHDIAIPESQVQKHLVADWFDVVQPRRKAGVGRPLALTVRSDT